MVVTRFLERKAVIRFFGVALILAPFFNMALHIFVLKSQNHMTWKQLSLMAYLKTGNPVSYALAIASIGIGIRMLSGSTKAWQAVLYLIGAHLLLQIININNKAWQGPLAWPTFLINAGLFFYIFDQLVWKVQPTVKKTETTVQPVQSNLTVVKEKHIIHLTSYRKILFNFGSDKPWGELKTLSSEEVSVKKFTEPPPDLQNYTVQMNFAKDIIIDIKFSHFDGDIYYFKPLNMDKDNAAKLNNWLKKIAV